MKLNGVGIKMNLAAFAWGRRAAVDEAAVRAVISTQPEKTPETLDEIVARRVAFLTDYQNATYAGTYLNFVARVKTKSESLALVVAKNLFKLMAYKDEYEVARLYSDGGFAANLSKQFKGDFTLKFHLAPPILGRVDGFTSKPLKTVLGPWMMTGFKLLAKLKGLRGTGFDVFGRTAERRMERQLMADYRALIDSLLPQLTESNLPVALEIAALPDMIRGFGHVKAANAAKAKTREAELVAAFGSQARVGKIAAQ